ncbi:ABC transporter ATP-binding protein [Leeia sp.]|uniref:ABC transporter ATP-binding protein n=1 Tax=Leeia sp. TaxID=2884678 RepID=UPI0035B36C9B
MSRLFWSLLQAQGQRPAFWRLQGLSALDVLLQAVLPLAAINVMLSLLPGASAQAVPYWLVAAALSPLLRLLIQHRARMLGTRTVFSAFGLLRQQLVERVLRAPLWQVRRWTDSELIERVGNDVRLLQEGVFIVLVRLQSLLMLSLLLLLAMLYYNPLPAAMFLLLLAGCGVLAKRLMHTLQGRIAALATLQDRMMMALSSVIDGIRTLRQHGAFHHPQLRLQDSLQARQRGMLQSVRVFSLRDLLLNGMLELALLLLLALLVLNPLGWSAVQLLPLLILSPLVYFNLSAAWQEWGLLKWSLMAWGRLKGLHQLPPQVDTSAPLPSNVQANVQAQALQFSYERHAVLNGFSATFPAGSHTVVVGRNGAGKSTLLALLVRFYDADAGQLSVDGHAIQPHSLASWRQQVSVVLQQDVLLPGTVRENLLLGAADADDDRLWAALRVVCCDQVIAAWPEGLDTPVGQGGVALSGGEQQRLAIARAWLKDAPVVLLDEITSGLDSENALQVQKAIQALSRQRTVIQITHALQHAVEADQVIVMDAGRVCERGTHQALLQQGGQYARWWRQYRQGCEWQLQEVSE